MRQRIDAKQMSIQKWRCNIPTLPRPSIAGTLGANKFEAHTVTMKSVRVERSAHGERSRNAPTLPLCGFAPALSANGYKTAKMPLTSSAKWSNCPA